MQIANLQLNGELSAISFENWILRPPPAAANSNLPSEISDLKSQISNLHSQKHIFDQKKLRLARAEGNRHNIVLDPVMPGVLIQEFVCRLL